MVNFTVGPVQEYDYTLELAKKRTPYFRNEYFSNIMKENEAMTKELCFASRESKVVFLTASGTGAMEASVANCLSSRDKVLIINGGGFGERFVQLCDIYKIPYDEIKVPIESNLSREMLYKYDGDGYTTLLINMHETSIGKLYDMGLVSEFCKKNNIFLIVDAISSFLADPLYMDKWGIDILIASSQKALALPPGISFLVLSENAIKRIYHSNYQGMYFDLKVALKDGERGQTPFTPAVSILIQMNLRLKRLIEVGIEEQWKQVEKLALYFRNSIDLLPVRLPKYKLSNAVTPVWINNMNAHDLFEKLEKNHKIWVCPNGGEIGKQLFRVGHIGDLKEADYELLIAAIIEEIELII